MNPEAQAELDRILKINPDDVSEADAAFLRARSSYLKKSQLEEYAHVLSRKPDTEAVTDSRPSALVSEIENQTSTKETVKSHAKSK